MGPPVTPRGCERGALPVLVALALALAACRSEAPAAGPLLTSVSPSQASAEAEVPLQIHGEHLVPRVRADFKQRAGSSLDATFTASLVPADPALPSIPLLAVALTAPGTLAATVPSGLEKGLYHLEVVDPAGQAGLLEGAYRVVTSAENVAAFRLDVAAPARARVPAAVSLTAVDADGRVVDGFAGTVTLTSSGSPGAPVEVGPFVAGRLRATFTPAAAAPALTLEAVDALGHRGSSDPFEVKDGLVTQVAFTSAAHTVAAGGCSQPLTLEARDHAGVGSAVEAPLTLALAAGPSTGVSFYADAACATAVQALTLAAGSASATFHFRALRAGGLNVRAAPATVPSALQLQTVLPGAATRVVFTTPALTLKADACSAKLRVAAQDGYGNEAPVAQAVSLALSANPAAGVAFFADDACTTALSALDLSVGERSAELHFRASAPGTVTLSATPDQPLTAATQAQTVVP